MGSERSWANAGRAAKMKEITARETAIKRNTRKHNDRNGPEKSSRLWSQPDNRARLQVVFRFLIGAAGCRPDRRARRPRPPLRGARRRLPPRAACRAA